MNEEIEIFDLVDGKVMYAQSREEFEDDIRSRMPAEDLKKVLEAIQKKIGENIKKIGINVNSVEVKTQILTLPDDVRLGDKIDIFFKN